MPAEQTPASDESSEDGRALLQARVALFWKVMFYISILSCVLGALGAIAKPGSLDLIVSAAQTVQTGVFWWLLARGQRSRLFSRSLEIGGLAFNVTIGALMGRFVVLEFVRDQGLVTAEGSLMADAFISLLHVAGYGLWLAVRAALVPSTPRFSAGVTVAIGVPLVGATLLSPAVDSLAWRAHDSPAYPWLPSTAVLIWSLVVITCTVITWVIYGLRAEVRQALRLGQYVLEKKIGEGGMGEVYRARHGMMRRPSALKLMKKNAGASSLSRFEREVQLTARLTHPNTITIYDYGRTHDGVFYYVMELLDGATLQRIVRTSGAQPPERVVRILMMACGALNEAHGSGLIHRDIKPANIMLCMQGAERDVVKLLDFGLVKDLEVGDGAEMTGANAITGTPQYMAPESILRPGAADARTDIYSLGAVAYFLLSGRDVFEGDSVVEICSRHIHEKPSPFASRGVSVPSALEAIVLGCLEKEPANRPQSAAELRRLLQASAVNPWSAEDAAAWWQEHRAALSDDSVESVGTARTIAVYAR